MSLHEPSAPAEVSTTAASKTWLDLARAQVARQGLDAVVSDVLCAFGGPQHAPGPVSLSVETKVINDLVQSLAQQLSVEIDEDQARMFARRFQSVANMLDSESDNDDDDQEKNETTKKKKATLQLLRVGLYRRAHQILYVDPPPRALRVRALVDFVWSVSVLLAEPEKWSQRPSLSTLLEGIHYENVAPGCRHATVEGASSGGPVHINILRVRNVQLRTMDARRSQQSHHDLTTLAGPEALAAISGGFFLYSEPDILLPSRRTDPVGLLVTNGVVVSPPVFRRASLLQDVHGQISIERMGMQGVRVQIANLDCTFTVGTDGVQCVHRGHTKQVTLQNTEIGISIVKTQVCEVSLPTDTQRTIAVPLAGFVLLIPSSLLSDSQRSQIREGDIVSYTLPRPGIHSAMAGGPLLYSDDPNDNALNLQVEDFCGSAPPVTFSSDETFDHNLLPRMGAGLTADGELVLAAIDGRNLEQALGLTLRGTADLLRELGCVRAMNLDGGSSKRMYVRGKGVVCLSTTEIKAATNNPGDAAKLRPVHSAVLIFPHDEANVGLTRTD